MKNDYLFKIRVHNSKESEEVQTELFSLGFRWNAGEKEVLYLNEKHLKGFILLFYRDFLRFVWYDEVNFRREKCDEITLKELKDKDFQKKLKKMMILKALE